MVSPTPPLAGPQRPRRRQRRRAAGPSGSWFDSLRRGRGSGRMWGRKRRMRLPFRCPSQRFLSRKLDPACWTSHLSPRRGCRRLKGETFSFLLPGIAVLLRISPFFPAPLPPLPRPQPAEARFHGLFSCSFHWEGDLVEGSLWPGEDRGPRRFAFPLLLLPTARLSSVLVWRLATGGHGFPPSERLECGGVFLWFCYICMFARVILFSLLVFL